MTESNESAIAHEGRLSRLETNLGTLLHLVEDIKRSLDTHPARMATLEAEQASANSATARAFAEINVVRQEMNNLGGSVNKRFEDAAKESTRIDSRLSKWVYLLTGGGLALGGVFTVLEAFARFIVPAAH